MSDTEKTRTLSAARLQPLLPVLAALLAILALLLAWNGWRQWQAQRDRSAVEAARDQAVAGVAGSVEAAQAQLLKQLQQPAAQAALARGDLAAAAKAVRQGWEGVERVEVLPASLDSAYARLPEAGYGRLAVAEAAVSGNAPAAGMARVGKASQLVVAAPANAAGQPPAVAVAQLPGAVVAAAMDGVAMDADNYLSLRQGDADIRALGNSALAPSAEVLARDVPGTGLRVAAAASPGPEGLFGLGGLPALVAALVLALAAAACAWRWRRGPVAATGAAGDAGAQAPTLTQALASGPPPAAAGEAGVEEAEAVAKPVIADAPAVPREGPAVAIDRGIFRAYDIRGVVGESLDTGVAEHIGQAVGSLMHEQDLTDIVVGRDGRLSGPDMVAGLVAGLRKAGRNVIDIGMAPTPVVYFGSYQLRTGCCIAVTGSHNPPDYNGFKIVVGGETLSGDAITDLYERIAGGRLHMAGEPGGLVERDINHDYVERIADDIQLQRPLKVVVDAGNGVAGEIGPRVLEAIGAQVERLYCEIDGTFPNHHPDPSEPHNLEDLVAKVQELGAELGLAFDGDGDRLGVVTPAGENIFPDRLLMLMAADVLERNPGAVILYDVKCTGHLSDHVLRHGGSPLMWKTGHSLIKAKMRETGAELAGEMSGHFFFAERWYGFDDGIYAAARLLEILADRDEVPGDVLEGLPGGVSTPEIKIPAPEGDPHGFVDGFREQAVFEDARVSTIDGVRVDWNDGWGLVRASNTTPVLVLRFDADDEAALQRIQQAFREQLQAYRPGLDIPF